jgi:hypothetical protein
MLNFTELPAQLFQNLAISLGEVDIFFRSFD